MKNIYFMMKLFIFRKTDVMSIMSHVLKQWINAHTHKDLEIDLGMRLSRESASDIAQR